MDLENAKIRRIILAEHDVLRRSLHEISELLDKVVKGDAPAQEEAHHKVQALLKAFMKHIEHEEQILVPVLEKSDAGGVERATSMGEEHKAQRKIVTHLAGVQPSRDPTGWAAEVRVFIEDLLVDMAAEEKNSLAPTVLRDDIIAVDGSSE